MDNFAGKLAGGASKLGASISSIMGPITNRPTKTGSFPTTLPPLSSGGAAQGNNYQKLYGPVTGPNGSPYWKYGVDIDLKVGDPVYSPVSGRVIAARENGGFGNQVKILDDRGAEVWLSHLDKGLVNIGQLVKAGQHIGFGGNTGKVIKGPGGDGSHLDLTVKQGNRLLSAQEALRYANEWFANRGAGGPSDGKGGPLDNFGDKLATGASKLGASISNIMGPVRTSMPSTLPPLSSGGGTGADGNDSPRYNSKATGMRTDRHNNPAAFTTDIAKQAGLIPNVDYTIGDPFPNNPNLRTARLIGDPISQTIKVIDKIGFYTQAGKPRWSYTASLPGVQNWKNLDYAQKAKIIAIMYQHEGGNGSLVKGIGQGGPSDGQGGPMEGSRLGNAMEQALPTGISNIGQVSTQYGQPTRFSKFHRGVDIANREGTPIPALQHGGMVVEATKNDPEHGNTIMTRLPDGSQERYSHLKKVFVQPGQRLNKGQQIGEMGATGNVYSEKGGDPSHLHYEIINAYKKFVNPLQYLSH